jgi:hypothetical protein
MKISLRLINKFPDKNGNYPLFIRLRAKDANGKHSETNISTGFSISSNHIINGVLSSKTPNYASKSDHITSIWKDLDNIISDIRREGLIPNPRLVKKRFFERESIKDLNTPKIVSFWESFYEYKNTKKHTSPGYKKSIIKLENRLHDYETFINSKLTFEYVVNKHKNFQLEFQDYLWSKEYKCSNNYVNKLLKMISHFLNYCFDNNYIQKKPKFTRNEVFVNDDKIYLNISEIKKLFKSKKWDYDESKDLTKNPHIYIINDVLLGSKKDRYEGIRKITNWELVKDIFLFQCSVGARYGDIQYFKVKDFDFDKDFGNSVGDKKKQTRL